MAKNGDNNIKQDGKPDGNESPDAAWILPFLLVGAMFGSMVGAELGATYGQPNPFMPALIGTIAGILLVGVAGLLAIHSLRSS